MNWYIKCLKQYADFSGRARRMEYWMFFLFNLIIAFVLGIVLGIISGATGSYGVVYLSYIYSLAVFIPGLAVGVRRMHDIGKSGWWFCINLIPLIGNIWFIVLACQDSVAGSNQWGENPKGI